MIINHNGRFIDADRPIATGHDGAWLFGDTLFETMKAKDGRILFLQQHLDRLSTSAQRLDFPLDLDSISAALHASVQQADTPVSRIRLTVSRGPFTGLAFPSPDASHFLIEVAPYTEPGDAERKDGIDVVITPNRRVNPLSHLPQMKRGNYADCLYAANFAREQGVREALFVDENDRLLEGATSNIFLARDDRLITPALGNLVLPGIVREQVLEIARAWGLVTEERDVQINEIYSADELFICNSLIDILPVASCEGKGLNRGELWLRFLVALNEKTETISA